MSQSKEAGEVDVGGVARKEVEVERVGRRGDARSREKTGGTAFDVRRGTREEMIAYEGNQVVSFQSRAVIEKALTFHPYSSTLNARSAAVSGTVSVTLSKTSNDECSESHRQGSCFSASKTCCLPHRLPHHLILALHHR